MGLLDDIGKKIAKSGQDAVKKAKDIAESTRLNGQIAEEQHTLKAFYAQIGEKYYAMYKDSPHDEFSQLCVRITAGLQRIADLQADVQKLKNTVICPKCGAECPSNVQFCSTCGAQLPQPEPEPEPVKETEAAVEPVQETTGEPVKVDESGNAPEPDAAGEAEAAPEPAAD